MNDNMKEFLTKLADLMEEHDVDVEVHTDDHGYPSEIFVEVNAGLSPEREYDYISLRKYLDCDVVRKAVKNAS